MPRSSMIGEILLVEDDVELAFAIANGLRSEHYRVAVVHDGEAALATLEDGRFDLVLLDLLLPGISGLEVCTTALRDHPELAIVIITAQSGLSETVRGLEAGADDYLVKPFGIAELRARVHAVLRRHGVGDDAPIAPVRELDEAEVVRCGKCVLRVTSDDIFVDDHALVLRPREEQILRLFLRRPSVVLTRSSVNRLIGGATGSLSSATIDWHVHELRRRLIDASGEALIESVYGLGWRLAPPEGDS